MTRPSRSGRLIPVALAVAVWATFGAWYGPKAFLDKYMGDAIMAIFGAPLDQPDHALRCCNAALDMKIELENLRRKWREEGLPEIYIGIGINTGDMIVGNMGSNVKFEYTVIGDNVNLGSRLEGTNKEYGTTIIISEYTYAVVSSEMITRELDLLKVKGKKEPVRIYELRGRGAIEDNEKKFISVFAEGLVHYRAQRWDEAAMCFDSAMHLVPGDPPSKRFLDRIELLKQNPPGQGWDGVWEMKTK
jgi:adenylate cyclase